MDLKLEAMVYFGGPELDLTCGLFNVETQDVECLIDAYGNGQVRVW